MSKRGAIGSIAICLLVILFLGGWAYYNSPGAVFFRSYRQLRLSMKEDRVQLIYGRAPDYACSFKAGKIHYYSRGWIGDSKPNSQMLPTSIHNANQIPCLYGAGSFLFDKDDLLVAFTVCGEERFIHTTQGNYEGSDLKRLSGKILDQLVN